MNTLFALADCNNFYVSCERVFNPSLQNKPVVVLSNNDGCIVARSNEAKSFGIPMGMPLFKAKDIIDKNNISVLSSNYALYSDMSNRVMQTLSEFTPSMEVYSIDEAFLNLQGIDTDITKYCKQIRNTCLKWTGIPVSIGVAKTKTLAKLANNLAKNSTKAKGVLDLSEKYIDKALEKTPVEDVWGIGRRISAKLKQQGIFTAKQLSMADTSGMQKMFSVSVVKTVLELRGQRCFMLEQSPESNKNITVSRSFGEDIETKEHLLESLCTYISKAAAKMRKSGLCADSLTVFAMNNRFDRQNAYHRAFSVMFDTATDDSFELIKAVEKLTNLVYCENIKFKKAGVTLSGLVQKSKVRRGLFDDMESSQKSKSLMTVIDRINSTGQNVYFASEGLTKPWQTKFNCRSNCYTTRWEQLPIVKG